MKGQEYNILNQSTDLGIGKISNPNTQIMRVDLDGGFHVNESIPATDAAKEVLRIIKGQWLADAQATKIRELQASLNEANERNEHLRDKIDGLYDLSDSIGECLQKFGKQLRRNP